MRDPFRTTLALSPSRFATLIAVVAAVTGSLTAAAVARSPVAVAQRSISVVTPTTMPATEPTPVASVAPTTAPATTIAPVLDGDAFIVSRSAAPAWSTTAVSSCHCTVALPWGATRQSETTLASGATAHITLSEKAGTALSAAVWTVTGDADTADVVNALGEGARATVVPDGAATLVTLETATSKARTRVVPTAGGMTVLLVASTQGDPTSDFNRMVASFRG